MNYGAPDGGAACTTLLVLLLLQIACSLRESLNVALVVARYLLMLFLLIASPF